MVCRDYEHIELKHSSDAILPIDAIVRRKKQEIEQTLHGTDQVHDQLVRHIKDLELYYQRCAQEASERLELLSSQETSIITHTKDAFLRLRSQIEAQQSVWPRSFLIAIILVSE